MSYSKRSSQRRSFTPLAGEMPMSVFRKDLFDEVGKGSYVGGGEKALSLRSGGGSRRRSGQRRSTSLRIRLDRDSIGGRSRRSMGGGEPRRTKYIRPTGSELVSSKHPSCLGLPPTWNYIHDRFIAYLATHAPLDKNGRVPRHEEGRERWRTEDIVRELGERFEELEGTTIKVSMIEKRLALLDQAGDNDYFKIPYGAYRYEEWGRGI